MNLREISLTEILIHTCIFIYFYMICVISYRKDVTAIYYVYSRLLRAKYDANHAAIFQDLKPPSKLVLDLLEVTHEYEILAVDVDTWQVHVHPPIDARGCSRWLVDDVPVTILLDEDQPDLCTILSGGGTSLDSTLIQHQNLTDTASIQDDLLTYWRKTWCALSEVDLEVGFGLWVSSVPSSLSILL